MREDRDDPSKPLFDVLEAATERMKSIAVPTWEQYAKANSEGRRCIARIWVELSHISVAAMLNGMEFTRINGPIDAPNDREFEYDGDMGRGHSDYMRDNGHRPTGFAAETWQQVAEHLPVMESPSIVPSQSQTDEVIASISQSENTDG